MYLQWQYIKIYNDENTMIKNTSIFYGDEDKEFSGSLLSYKWLKDDND